MQVFLVEYKYIEQKGEKEVIIAENMKEAQEEFVSRHDMENIDKFSIKLYCSEEQMFKQ